MSLLLQALCVPVVNYSDCAIHYQVAIMRVMPKTARYIEPLYIRAEAGTKARIAALKLDEEDLADTQRRVVEAGLQTLSASPTDSGAKALVSQVGKRGQTPKVLHCVFCSRPVRKPKQRCTSLDGPGWCEPVGARRNGNG